MSLRPHQAPLPGPSRRDFVFGGLTVGLAFFASPVLARPPRNGKLHDARLTRAPVLDENLQVLAAFLSRYRPPDGAIPAAGPWRANYDLIEWEGSPAGEAFFRRNQVLGSMAVTRRIGSSGGPVEYDLDYAIRIRGFDSALRANMTCSGDRLPRLLRWDSRYDSRRCGQREAGVELRETGVHDGGEIVISSAAGRRRIACERPIATQWAVLDFLRGAKADGPDAPSPIEFDLYHDLTSYRPRQTLSPFGRIEVSLGDIRSTLHGFVQTGAGTPPTHYWIDASGRPLLVTGGLLSIALAPAGA